LHTRSTSVALRPVHDAAEEEMVRRSLSLLGDEFDRLQVDQWAGAKRLTRAEFQSVWAFRQQNFTDSGLAVGVPVPRALNLTGQFRVGTFQDEAFAGHAVIAGPI